MLKIRVVSFKGQALQVPMGREFGTDGGSIGREPNNLLILPDPDRRVSRTHAQVRSDRGGFILTDTGSNPLQINGSPLGKGKSVYLTDGDRLKIGDYELAVDYDAGGTLLVAPKAAGHNLDFGAVSRKDDWPTPVSDIRPGADPLQDALRQGLGLPDLEFTRENMELIGRLLSESMAGVVGLLQARAALKQDLQAEVTVLSTRRNNPLKFSRNGHMALAQLLAPPMRGFMAPDEAVKDACDDINSHLYGVMAGMEAALEGLLTRFTPEQLERELGRHVVLDLVPMHRKARLWDTFQARHGEIREAAASDFAAVFGREFLRAYEARIQALESGTEAPRGAGER